MAAQSARDRKKKKMMDLEKENNCLAKERMELMKRNRYLVQKLKLYMEENDNLRQKLGIEPIKLEPECDDTMDLYDPYDKSNSHDVFEDDDDDDDDYDDDGSDEDGYQSSTDNYSSTSTANAFESAELINVPLPKVQVLAEKDGKMANVQQQLLVETIDKSTEKSNHQQKQRSTKNPQTKTCSLQQLTNFLMVLLTTISLNSNNNNNNRSCSVMEPIINLVLKQLSQIKLNSENYPQEMDLELSQCLSELAKQCQLNSLMKRYQRKHVRLRI